MNPILKSIIHKQRSDFEKLSAGRHIPDKALDGVHQARGIRYKQDGDPAHVMDMYCPNTVKIPTPVVINVHGGGLIMGSKEFNRHFCINLCKMGFIVFSVEYRLCPEVTVFQQLEDIYAAMNYIDGLMPQLKAELGHCYMVGDSAGAMLAMYASAIQRNPRLVKAAGVRPSYLEIMSLALISGMFYTTRMDKIGLVMPKAFYGDQYKKHPFYPYLNPDNIAVSMYLPPCMLITSRADHLRNYTYDLAASIRHNRAPCILRDYGRDPNLTHAFSVFDPELPESWTVIEDIASFFTDYE